MAKVLAKILWDLHADLEQEAWKIPRKWRWVESVPSVASNSGGAAPADPSSNLWDLYQNIIPWGSCKPQPLVWYQLTSLMNPCVGSAINVVGWSLIFLHHLKLKCKSKWSYNNCASRKNDKYREKKGDVVVRTSAVVRPRGFTTCYRHLAWIIGDFWFRCSGQSEISVLPEVVGVFPSWEANCLFHTFHLTGLNKQKSPSQEHIQAPKCLLLCSEDEDTDEIS